MLFGIPSCTDIFVIAKVYIRGDCDFNGEDFYGPMAVSGVGLYIECGGMYLYVNSYATP